jgi:hypothetical protein
MFTEAKNLVVKSASHILHQFVRQLNQIPSHLIEVGKIGNSSTEILRYLLG